MYYTGIGSRNAPSDVLSMFRLIGQELSTKNVILRSGHAEGSDLAFEIGCDKGNKRNKEIWLPWANFNGSDSKFIVSSPEAFAMARDCHPAWDVCSSGAKKLHARNMHQILGEDLRTPSSFVICYTRGGKLLGGTAQAIRLASKHNIPVFNLGVYEDCLTTGANKLSEFLGRFGLRD